MVVAEVRANGAGREDRLVPRQHGASQPALAAHILASPLVIAAVRFRLPMKRGGDPDARWNPASRMCNVPNAGWPSASNGTDQRGHKGRLGRAEGAGVYALRWREPVASALLDRRTTESKKRRGHADRQQRSSFQLVALDRRQFAADHDIACQRHFKTAVRYGAD